MSSESSPGARAPSRRNNGTFVPRDLAKPKSSKLGTVVRALWPIKPALNLAQRVGITERHAQYLIDGERKPSARAALVLLMEIIDAS